MDDKNLRLEILKKYQREELPEYSTLHGAFFDVIPFSMDNKIRSLEELKEDGFLEK